jgi:phage shock protein C
MNLNTESSERNATVKRLYLSASDRKLAGVCGGLGEYLDADPTLIRLATAVIAIATGVIPMLLGYLVAWIIIPRRPAA